MELKNVKQITENETEIEIILNDFSHFFENMKQIETNGYVLEKEWNLKYDFKGPKKLTVKLATAYEQGQPVLPNYKESMVNLVASLEKYYGKTPNFTTLSDLDVALNRKEYKHVIFLVLDGLAPYAILDVCSKTSFLRKYFVRKMSSLFPSTTACAIPASQSGKLAYETGWLGWENYFEEYNRHLVMFTGENYLNHEQTGIDVEKILPFPRFFQHLGVKYYDVEPSFKPNGCQNFKEMVNRLIDISKKDERSFTYAYFTEPDSTMHHYGVYSDETKKVLSDLSKELNRFEKNVADDTLMVITADHGHIDVNKIDLFEYEELYETLERLPSNESRALCFKVKEGQNDKFESLFKKYFKSIYELYSKDEFIRQGFLGNKNKPLNKHLDSFLGDYIAVAKANYYFSYVKSDYIFKSHHAGMTKKEMETPLIIYPKFKL